MLKIKLIILGVLLSITTAYSIPVGISPSITSISRVTSNSFTVNWSAGIVTGLNLGSTYHLNYIVTVSGPGGASVSTVGLNASFSGLQPSTKYSIRLETYGTIIGEISYVSFSPVTTSITTSEAPTPDVNEVSTDYTLLSSQNVILKAKTRIILKSGFHYKATNGYSLVTQLLPNTKSSNEIDDYTVYPECYYLEVGKQNSSEVLVYEIMQPQQGSLLIRNENFDYNATVKSEYFEIVEMNTGRISKRGNLSGYETQIDVSDLKGGFYVVKVANGKQVYTQKIAIRN